VGERLHLGPAFRLAYPWSRFIKFLSYLSEKLLMAQEKKILIIEDDSTLANAIGRGLEAKGFEPVICNRAETAYQKLKLEPFRAVIIDCFLPGEKGVDCAAKIKDQNLTDAPLFLMSGVFKDKVFIREAMARTGSTDFFVKPFLVDEIIYLIESQNEDRSILSRPPLFRIFWQPDAETGDILKAVDMTSSCHGYELAILLGFVMQGGLPGKLTVTSPENQIVNIYFNNDEIVSVEDGSDLEKTFCRLAEEFGYLPPNFSTENLNPGEKIEQYLVRQNLISPHAAKELQLAALTAQLTYLLKDTTYTINFDITPDLPTDRGLNLIQFRELLMTWCWSHIPSPWLKAFYVRWMDQVVIKGPLYEKLVEIQEHPLFQRVPNLDKLFVSNKSLDWLLTDSNFNEHDFLAAAHYLAINRVIAYGERGVNDIVRLKSRLKKTLADFEKKNYFQILNVSNNAPESEIKKSYHELVKVFHPDKQAHDLPKEIVELTRKIFDKVQSAFNVLIKDGTKRDYLRELEQGNAQSILDAETVYESSFRMVNNNQFQSAIESLDGIRGLETKMPKVALLRMWATLKLGENKQGSINIAELVSVTDAMPMELRSDAVYLLVKGLIQNYLGNKANAASFIDKAVAAKSDFIAAQREQRVLNLEKSNTSLAKGILKADLRDVFSGLFKKKSS